MNKWIAVLASLAIAVALWRLQLAQRGTLETATRIGTIPARIYRPASGGLGPVVVIAHGFAGSQQLMQSFALTFAANGYVVVSFDFPGHGRNPEPLTGSITEASGATRTLLEALRQVADYAHGLGDGRLAVLGHSMASDIVVRYAESSPDVVATIAVSMFSPVVTATLPRDLLVIVGDWESMLKREALRAVGLTTAPRRPEPETTYGSFAQGSARRASFSPHVEHVSVLFSETSMREALAWLDHSFGIVRTRPASLASRGPWLLLLLAAGVALARPLSTLLPRIAVPAGGAGLAWRELRLPLLLPPIATPLVLRVLPTHFLPVLVGDYLAVHFFLYGLLTLLCLGWLRRGRPDRFRERTGRVAVLVVTAAATLVAYGFLAIVWPIDRFFTSFVPGPERLVLIAAMLVGTSTFFLSDEWLTRGAGAARGAYFVSKVAFLLSLAGAVALDFQRLFFLVIIEPDIVLFFLIYGLLSAWAYRRTGQPLVAGIANAIACAWAIGVTFPLLAG